VGPPSRVDISVQPGAGVVNNALSVTPVVRVLDNGCLPRIQVYEP